MSRAKTPATSTVAPTSNEDLNKIKLDFFNAMNNLAIAAGEAARNGMKLFDELSKQEANLAAMAASASVEPEGDSKKRKRKPKDPNAPKRPLTAYFLYMQTARSIIKEHLGGNATNKEVTDAAVEQWKNMPEEEKNKWNAAYQREVAKYRQEQEEYLKKLAKEGKEPATIEEEHEPEGEAHETEEEEHEEEAAEEEAAEEEAATTASSSPSPPPPSPKRRGRKAKANGEAATPAKATPQASKATPKSAKKALLPILPAPEADKKGKKAEKETKKTKEASPEKRTRKRRKSGAADS